MTIVEQTGTVSHGVGGKEDSLRQLRGSKFAWA